MATDITDQEKQWRKDMEERDKRRSELYFALRSRPLTNEEIREVFEWDYRLAIDFRQTYNVAEKMHEFTLAIAIQALIQIAALRQLHGGD